MLWFDKINLLDYAFQILYIIPLYTITLFRQCGWTKSTHAFKKFINFYQQLESPASSPLTKRESDSFLPEARLTTVSEMNFTLCRAVSAVMRLRNEAIDSLRVLGSIFSRYDVFFFHIKLSKKSWLI